MIAIDKPGVRQIVVARPLFERALQELIGRGGEMARLGQAQINRAPQLLEFICTEHAGRTGGVPAFVVWKHAVGALQHRSFAMAQEDQASQVVLITVEQEPNRGRLGAFLISPSGPEPVHRLKIVGAGMHKLSVQDGQAAIPGPVPTRREQEKWSRFIGALSEAVWRRLRALHYCLVGVGRMGSLVASTLARWGAQRVTIIDPDAVELHNTDSGDGVSERDVGRMKVSAIRDHVVSLGGPGLEVNAISESVTSLRALSAAKEADFLISCVDDSGARLATGIIATLYAKPQLDIGTGVFNESGGSQSEAQNRRMGGDIRLILPGENRCLLCFGGVGDLEAARAIFSTQRQTVPVPWHQQRAGSLRSLNQIVAHIGLFQLQELVGERVNASRWLHLELDNEGIPSIQNINPPLRPACPLCRQYGAADEGMRGVRDLESFLTENTTQ